VIDPFDLSHSGPGRQLVHVWRELRLKDAMWIFWSDESLKSEFLANSATATSGEFSDSGNWPGSSGPVLTFLLGEGS